MTNLYNFILELIRTTVSYAYLCACVSSDKVIRQDQGRGCYVLIDDNFCVFRRMIFNSQFLMLPLTDDYIISEV